MDEQTEVESSPPSQQGGTIKIEYYHSAIGSPKKHKVIVRSIGLKRINQTVERPDTPNMRGVVNKLPHLLRIVE